MKLVVWRSKLARRLVVLFALLVAVPVVVTVVTLGIVGQDQVVRIARTMERINAAAVTDAAAEFQRLGRKAVGKGSAQTEAISVKAIRSVSRHMQRAQNESLASTAKSVAELTRSRFEEATRHSVSTNDAALRQVGEEMTSLFERSARDTQERAASRVEAAMRAQIDAAMQERAGRLAFLVDEHLKDSVTALAISAQMPQFTNGDAAGQKNILEAMVRRHGLFTQIAVLDEAGRETAKVDKDAVVTAADLGDRSAAGYFRDAFKGARHISVEGGAGGGGSAAPVLRVAVPLEKWRGNVAGVLTARLPLDDLWDTLRSARIGDNGFAYLVDAKGRELLAPRKGFGALIRRKQETQELGWSVVVAQPQAEVLRPVASVKQAIDENTGRALAEMRVKIRHSSAVASERLRRDAVTAGVATSRNVQTQSRRLFDDLQEQTGRKSEAESRQMQAEIAAQARRTQAQSSQQMVLAAEQASRRLTERVGPLTREALTGAKQRLSVYAALILVAFCLLGAASALLLAGRIVRPVILLARQTREIAAGNLSGRVEADAADEIGDLAVAFNTMAESLQKSRAELQGAEAQLVQSAKLASLGTLSAGVAHELNQPVAIIRGVAQQLQGEPGLNEDVMADLDLIEGQTSRMMKIIKHLRTFSRVGAEERSEVAVNDVVRDCFVLIEAQLRAHDVAVEFDLCEGAPAVLADANELEQVFLNLITNARDANEGNKDARLTIRSRVEGGGRFVLTFADNGTGIPEGVLSHIFDPFFTTKEPGKGTGLGLSISHTIINKHGGTIAAHNDGGAVFTITLPLAETDTLADVAAAAGPQAKAA